MFTLDSIKVVVMPTTLIDSQSTNFNLLYKNIDYIIMPALTNNLLAFSQAYN
jgi:hypothetical protein